MNTVFQEIGKYEKIMENELTEYHRKKAEDAIENLLRELFMVTRKRQVWK